MAAPDIPTDRKVLIIPDIHNKIKKAEGIIERAKPSHTVFLGDYFDSFYEDERQTRNTARWLKKSCAMPDRTHLIGNHDLSYMTTNEGLRCVGYDGRKYMIISEAGIDWGRLYLYCWVGDWLCSHAGFTNKLYRTMKGTVREALESSGRDLDVIDDASASHPFLEAGTYRGGMSPVGGIVWCDYAEFEDIPGIRQVFGHTRDEVVRHVEGPDSGHYCIDTGLRHYAIYENDRLRVGETRNLQSGPGA